jgi:hypothetical protein
MMNYLGRFFQDGVGRGSDAIFPGPRSTFGGGIAAAAGPTLTCRLTTASTTLARVGFRRIDSKRGEELNGDG